MPARVKRVKWWCQQCGKQLWLRPHEAKVKKYCSRACVAMSLRVDAPVRAKQSLRPQYPGCVCAKCGAEYVARSKTQLYCSRGCALDSIHERRIDVTTVERPCEVCGAVFRPRPRSAGRFCSRACNFEGQRGAKAPNWRGGRWVDAAGYAHIHVPDHPAADRFGYVREHRYVMEQKLGRPVVRNEHVHHINGIKSDNRPENLELWSSGHPKGTRHDDPPHCPTCTCEG